MGIILHSPTQDYTEYVSVSKKINMDLEFSISFDPLQMSRIAIFGKVQVVWVSKYQSHTLDIDTR